MTKKLVITTIAAFSFITITIAQQKKPTELSLFTGTSIYMGDLSEPINGYTKNLSPHFGVAYKKTFSNFLQVGASLSYLTLKANEAVYTNVSYRPQRAFSFNGSMVEVSLNTFITPFGNNYNNASRKIMPYFGIGFGGGFYNLSRDYSQFNRTIFTDKTQAGLGFPIDSAAAMPKFITFIPITLGAKYCLNPNLSVFTEMVVKRSFADYLDGFKYAANPKSTDYYYSVNIGVSFSLNSSGINCPSTRQ